MAPCSPDPCVTNKWLDKRPQEATVVESKRERNQKDGNKPGPSSASGPHPYLLLAFLAFSLIAKITGKKICSVFLQLICAGDDLCVQCDCASGKVLGVARFNAQRAFFLRKATQTNVTLRIHCSFEQLHVSGVKTHFSSFNLDPPSPTHLTLKDTVNVYCFSPGSTRHGFSFIIPAALNTWFPTSQRS